MTTQFNRFPNGNYAFLLCGLIFVLLLNPMLHMLADVINDILVMRIGLMIGYSILLLTGVWSLHKETRLFQLGWALAIASVVLTVLNLFYSGSSIDILVSLVVLTFSVISAVIVGRNVFGSTYVNRNLLFGAICVYLLLGLIWALLYGLIEQFLPNSFRGLESSDHRISMDNQLYFSFVTLASLGYGDITPLSPVAKALSYLEAVTGQMYVAIMLAGLVGKYMKGTCNSDQWQGGHPEQKKEGD